MPRFLISVEASHDLNEIVDYCQTRSLDRGDRLTMKGFKRSATRRCCAAYALTISGSISGEAGSKCSTMICSGCNPTDS